MNACSVAQSCLTLCNPMDCSPSGSSVHGISQAKILEWVVISFSRVLPDPRIKPMSPALVEETRSLYKKGSIRARRPEQVMF